MTVDARVEAVTQGFAAHRPAPFPPRLRGADIAGIDMVMLDADTAGCIHVWLQNGGRLDAWRQQVIQRRLEHFDMVLPLLEAPQEVAHFRHLRDLAALIRVEPDTTVG